MTLRDRCNFEELEAHRILDMAAAGVDVPESVITWCFVVLGDALGRGVIHA